MLVNNSLNKSKLIHNYPYWKWFCSIYLTLILGSVKVVHIAISSLVLMSGYLFLVKSASNSCSCWEVKWVRCLRFPLAFVLLLLLPLFLLLIGLVSAFILELRILLISSFASALSICPWLVLVSGGLSGLLWLLGAVSPPKWCWLKWKLPGSETETDFLLKYVNRPQNHVGVENNYRIYYEQWLRFLKNRKAIIFIAYNNKNTVMYGLDWFDRSNFIVSFASFVYISF